MADVDWAGFAQRNQQNNLGTQLETGVAGFGRGLQIGAMMRQSNALNQARELEAQKEANILARTQALQQDLSGLSAVEDPYQRMQGLNNVMLKYPEMADKLKNQASFYSDEVKTSSINQLLPALNALNTGNKEVAIDRLSKTAEAYKNSGNKRGAEALYSYIDDIKGATDIAPLVQTGYLTLAGVVGPDKLMDALKSGQEYAKTQATQGDEISISGDKATQAALETGIKREEAIAAPYKTSEAKSNADKAAVAAKFAESNAALDLQKKGWDITKIQNDMEIAKQNSRIAAMNAQLAKEGNEIKRNELMLKAEDAQVKRDDLVNKKITDVEAARTNMDNMLNTAQRIISTPMNVIKNATGTVDTRLPTFRQDTADFEDLVDTLKSQAFLAQIPNIKGMGALSNAEGEKLQQALQNFSLRQSPERLLSNIKEAQRLVMKARKNVADQYGVPENKPDMPSVKTGAVTRVK